jgi:hypothetical protein
MAGMKLEASMDIQARQKDWEAINRELGKLNDNLTKFNRELSSTETRPTSVQNAADNRTPIIRDNRRLSDHLLPFSASVATGMAQGAITMPGAPLLAMSGGYGWTALGAGAAAGGLQNGATYVADNEYALKGAYKRSKDELRGAASLMPGLGDYFMIMDLLKNGMSPPRQQPDIYNKRQFRKNSGTTREQWQRQLEKKRKDYPSTPPAADDFPYKNDYFLPNNVSRHLTGQQAPVAKMSSSFSFSQPALSGDSQSLGGLVQTALYRPPSDAAAGASPYANLLYTPDQSGEGPSNAIQQLVDSYTNLGQTGDEQLRALADSTQEWGQINDEIMDAVSTQTYDLGEGVDLVFGQIGDGTGNLIEANRTMSESAVVDYGDACTAVTGWGDETETSFYNAETAVTGWGDETMSAFTGVGQEAGILGGEISGMGDTFNSAMGSMGQIGDQMFSGFETTAQNVIQGLISGDIKDLDDAWDVLTSGMEGVWQSTLNNLLSSFTNWISSLITNFARAGLNDLFSYISGGTGGNLGNYFNNMGGRPGPGAGPMGSGVPGGTTNWAGAGGGIVGGIAGAYAGGELGEAVGGKTGRSIGGMVGGIAGSVGGYKLATWLATEAAPQIAAQVGTQVGAQAAAQAAEWAAINAEIGAGGMAAEGGMNLGALAALASPAGAMAAAMAPGVIGSLISQHNLFGIGYSPKSRADVREEVDYAQSQVQAYSTDAGYMQGAEYGGRAQDAAKALMYGPQIEGEYSVEDWQAIIDSIDALGQKFLESGQKALEFDGSVTSLFERMAASEGSMTMHSLEAMAYTEEIGELAASLGFSGEAALQFQTELESLRESYALGGEEEILFNERMDQFVENTLRAADNTGLLKGLVDDLSASLGLGSEQSLRLGAAVNELFTDIKGQGGDLSDFEDQITELASAFGLGSKETDLLRQQLQDLASGAMASAENGISGVQTAVDDMNRKFGECGGVFGNFSDTIDGVNSHVDVFATSLDDLPDDIDIEVGLTPKPGRNQLGVSIRDQQIDLNWMHDGGMVGEPERYHAGDLIRSLAHDEVPIIAQRGEFMIRAANVNAATLPTLRAINGGAMAAPAGPNIIIQGPLVEVNGLSLDSPQVMEDVARAIEGQLRDLQNSRWQA